ncbi:hypothetical protein INS49_014637 [Diaporthe citri]|uniref:uncharacterized protein n=1 Tax=Diaporthe citri TaxID=83186 RepID=UPI001C81B24C|nr:uncharacterized protein INS49_014637 [Diaporthe citri]KAG6356763.1 hypothetical protein INS49_014637 [Diaporthe citri]
MDSFPVKLLLPDRPDFMVTPATQCVFEVIIPLGIPRLIDTSLPAPPYIGLDATYNGMQNLVRPTMRAIMSGLLRELLGSDYPVCSLLGSDPDGNICQSNRVGEWWDTKVILDKADLDLKAGTWKDQFGEEGHGPIDAQEEGITAIRITQNFTSGVVHWELPDAMHGHWELPGELHGQQELPGELPDELPDEMYGQQELPDEMQSHQELHAAMNVPVGGWQIHGRQRLRSQPRGCHRNRFRRHHRTCRSRNSRSSSH